MLREKHSILTVKDDVSCGLFLYYVLYEAEEISQHSNFRVKFAKAREVITLAQSHTANTHDANLDFPQPHEDQSCMAATRFSCSVHAQPCTVGIVSSPTLTASQ